jgi:sugar/nucleoside kinase (ribokinase family)
MSSRNGIIAGGNWIVDYLKLIDTYPQENALGNILHQSISNGGSPYNILINLAKLEAPFPLEGIGILGKDANGNRIIDHCKKHRITTRYLLQTKESPTSYTDVMA